MAVGKRVFVSHASADKALVEAFQRVLESGIGFTHSQIFCSSIPGQGVPSGKDFKAHIREELATADACVMLITPNFYASPFCMCELGATWASAQKLIPIVVPPLDFKNLKAVLDGVQSFRLIDADWDSIADELGHFAADPKGVAVWNSQRTELLSMITKAVNSLPAPRVVPTEDLEKAKKLGDDYLELTKQQTARISELEGLVDKLKAAKNKDEVAAIVAESVPERDQFKELVNAAQKSLHALPYVVRQAFYKRARGDSYSPDWQNDESALTQAEEYGYLIPAWDGGGLQPNKDNRKVGRAAQALTALKEFIGTASSDFQAWYEETHDDNLDYRLRSFWETNLKL